MLLNLQFHSCKTELFHRTSSDSKSKNWLSEVQGMGAVAKLKKLLTEAERNGLSHCKCVEEHFQCVLKHCQCVSTEAICEANPFKKHFQNIVNALGNTDKAFNETATCCLESFTELLL